MNLEIANRLVALRKEKHLSQEALAEKLGISRQAVSKWERAEASPDTDNLIALARLYHISLDELLMIHEEEDDEFMGGPQRETGMQPGEFPFAGRTCIGGAAEEGFTGGTEPQGETESGGTEQTGYESYKGAAAGSDRRSGPADGEDDVHIGFNGIHVRDRNGDEVHIGWNGIHVHEKDNEVHIDKHGIYVNGEEAGGHIFTRGKENAELPLGIIAIVIYIMMGVFFDLWHPGWLIFLLVPVTGSLIHAVRRKNANLFVYPVLVVFVFLYVGLVHFIWHPTWVLFLTIPVYYSVVEYIRGRNKTDGVG